MHTRLDPSAIAAAGRAFVKRAGVEPKIHLVLGSGLGALADAVEDATSLSFAEIPGFPAPTVSGHSGRFLIGRLAGTPVLVQAGRYHFYEGHDESVVGAPIRFGRTVGCRTLIVTNAAGGIREELGPGRIMLITDHINYQGRNALSGPVVFGETRFPDMTTAYDPELRTLATEVAKSLDVRLANGCYVAVHGPTYETPAEIRMFAALGADAVGMSTVPEVAVARAGGMRCLGFSLITNHAAGKTGAALDHSEVVEVGRASGGMLGRIVEGVVAALGAD